MSLAAAEAAAVAAVPTTLLIDGWREAEGGATFAVDDPSTGETIAHVADGSVADAELALATAADAQNRWGRTPPRERADILRRCYELMLERSDELALVMTLEMGKPLAESHAEVAYAADYLRWFSEEAVRINGRWSVAPDGASRIWTMRKPVGPALLVTPWNFPLAMGTRKLGPALAAGCTAIVKPAKQTPLSMLALGALLLEAGLPADVVSIVTTRDSRSVVARLMGDARLRKLSFTGSTEVGRELVRQSAERMLRLSLELGGNGPFIVFDDADLDVAVEAAMRAKLRNNGEACTAANRIFVQEGVRAQFVDRLVEAFAGVRIGRGTEPGVGIGPLIDTAAVAKVEELVGAATSAGAVVRFRGEIPRGAGSYYPHTVVDAVPHDSRLVTEEIFGPVAPVVGFSDEDEVLSWANSSEYGLASYVFTRDLDRAVRVAERLETGMIGLNRGVLSNVAAPFGGWKSSGYGREGGSEGIEEYLETSYIALDAGRLG
ncbi:NAD-dependent succinate-semialdehyde dehydrogenase [Protaetiibacter intestinalis]|uniref:NAD-dependent succinate-semialdehyde dehydrogenase n=1 Tax=Protaetiibacter intestinalis TaxID=2419774 RepID=A0A387B559_9MICO|nr:NAD-dependent succinate-semialdehyde dehydrogenase [Protaetiibacter intestinalis]AYF98824.1 NAD-dependent succinate-semialdehyde dehydrogenase [Protaetiibacter intestinalis]